MFSESPPVLVPESRPGSPEEMHETQPLTTPAGRQRHVNWRGISYGSIVPTPPREWSVSPPLPLHDEMPALELPDPALNPSRPNRPRSPPLAMGGARREREDTATLEESSDPYHVGLTKAPHTYASSLPKHLFRSKPPGSPQVAEPRKSFTVPRSRLRRMFSAAGLESPALSDLQLDAYRELDMRQDDFFNFLDSELEKIEMFYREKENEATHRLQALRDQLHELRDRRMEDIAATKRYEHVHEGGVLDGLLPVTPLPTTPSKDMAERHTRTIRFSTDIFKRGSHIGKTSKAMGDLGSPVHPRGKTKEDVADYVRRKPPKDAVPYRFAKRRLKLALQEFYRGLELLKSYAILNRTGFRKINKKYDKAVNARPTGRYMSEKVNDAYFVTSSVIDGHLVAVEDLYARYFERGNHKLAVSKLRSKLKPADQSAPSFRNGLSLAAGVVCGIAGLVNAVDQLHSPDLLTRERTAYLLQLYGGYFLGLLLFLIFVLNCKIWTAARVNYIFVFEYDTRHVLDWRQLAELPCFFLFLNGFFLWLNFRGNAPDAMTLYWPVVLIGLTLVIMCLPFPVLYPHARKWWASPTGASCWPASIRSNSATSISATSTAPRRTP